VLIYFAVVISPVSAATRKHTVVKNILGGEDKRTSGEAKIY